MSNEILGSKTNSRGESVILARMLAPTYLLTILISVVAALCWHDAKLKSSGCNAIRFFTSLIRGVLKLVLSKCNLIQIVCMKADHSGVKFQCNLTSIIKSLLQNHLSIHFWPSVFCPSLLAGPPDSLLYLSGDMMKIILWLFKFQPRKIFPRPAAGLLRPIVHPPTQPLSSICHQAGLDEWWRCHVTMVTDVFLISNSSTGLTLLCFHTPWANSHLIY